MNIMVDSLGKGSDFVEKGVDFCGESVFFVEIPIVDIRWARHCK